MILSAALMLDWLGEKHDLPAARRAGEAIHRAVDAAFGSGRVRSFELGGNDGTRAIAAAVSAMLRSESVAA